MNFAEIDWRALERLRSVFLTGTASPADYWRDERDLASYDATFAQRIGWKWDHVLGELRRRGWTPPHGQLLDWGCGSGIAARAYLDFFDAEAVSELWLWDRSALAMTFAARRASQKYPGLPVHAGLPGGDAALPSTSMLPANGTLLVSHLLTELDAAQLDALLALADDAACVLWVEPGAHEASRALGAVRERLRGRFRLIAPCPHQGACGLLDPGQERHWCHHFAESPPEVFTDGDWARFAGIAGIDLRSLPLSYLVLDRREDAAPVLPDNAARLIGRPRIYKPYARIFACDASGVRDRDLSKRAFPDLYRLMKKGAGPSLLEFDEAEGGRVAAVHSLESEFRQLD